MASVSVTPLAKPKQVAKEKNTFTSTSLDALFLLMWE